MSSLPISQDQIDALNDAAAGALADDYGSLGRQLARRGIDIDAIKNRVANFSVAVPSWGTGRGGTTARKR